MNLANEHSPGAIDVMSSSLPPVVRRLAALMDLIRVRGLDKQGIEDLLTALSLLQNVLGKNERSKPGLSHIYALSGKEGSENALLSHPSYLLDEAAGAVIDYRRELIRGPRQAEMSHHDLRVLLGLFDAALLVAMRPYGNLSERLGLLLICGYVESRPLALAGKSYGQQIAEDIPGLKSCIDTAILYAEGEVVREEIRKAKGERIPCRPAATRKEHSLAKMPLDTPLTTEQLMEVLVAGALECPEGKEFAAFLSYASENGILKSCTASQGGRWCLDIEKVAEYALLQRSESVSRTERSIEGVYKSFDDEHPTLFEDTLRALNGKLVEGFPFLKSYESVVTKVGCKLPPSVDTLACGGTLPTLPDVDEVVAERVAATTPRRGKKSEPDSRSVSASRNREPLSSGTPVAGRLGLDERDVVLLASFFKSQSNGSRNSNEGSRMPTPADVFGSR